MSRILIEYGPDISEECMDNIRNNYSPSMVATDGSSSQYRLEDLLADIGDSFTGVDRSSLEKLVSDGVEYIEL